MIILIIRQIEGIGSYILMVLNILTGLFADFVRCNCGSHFVPNILIIDNNDPIARPMGPIWVCEVSPLHVTHSCISCDVYTK